MSILPIRYLFWATSYRFCATSSDFLEISICCRNTSNCRTCVMISCSKFCSSCAITKSVRLFVGNYRFHPSLVTSPVDDWDIEREVSKLLGLCILIRLIKCGCCTVQSERGVQIHLKTLTLSLCDLRISRQPSSFKSDEVPNDPTLQHTVLPSLQYLHQ